MRIIADSASLYTPEEGMELGVTIVPACVILNGKIYKDYEDISSEAFLKLIEESGAPTSSQPSIGDVLEILEQSNEEILYLSLGDGLSGAYQNAVGAKNMVEHNERIHIVDTKTLAGPQRYMVRKAVELKKAGQTIEQIKTALQKSILNSVSFVIPFDFDFLKRSGRLTPIAAKIGGLIKIVPVLTQTTDKRRIEPFAIKRSRKKAVEVIINHFKSIGVDKNYLISISHAGTYEYAKEILEVMKKEFINTTVELLHLSPTLITHGGPGSIVIQAVLK